MPDTKGWATSLRERTAERDQFRKQRDELLAALEFYRDAWTGHPGDSGPGGNTPQDPVVEPSLALLEDEGECARITIARIREQQA